jgi:hypothetical protein
MALNYDHKMLHLDFITQESWNLYKVNMFNNFQPICGGIGVTGPFLIEVCRRIIFHITLITVEYIGR